MNQMKNDVVKQVEYLGKWVPFEHFRAFVYGANDTQKLANSYFEYQALIATGLWFSIPEEVPKAKPVKETTVAVVEEKVTEVPAPLVVLEPEVKCETKVEVKPAAKLEINEPQEVAILEEKQMPKPVKGVEKNDSNR